MTRMLPAVLLAVALTTASVRGAPAAAVVAAELGAKLDRYLTESGFQGSVLVAKDGEVVLMKGYGLADREKAEPYATDTLVSIGSITKQFTAAAILKLEMEGKLAVEDPIGRFFKDAPQDKKAITLHQLLTHTSGLESDFAGDYEPVGRDEYVKRILAAKLRSKPGAEHFYANSGYSLLAAIVEIAAGQPYETYLQQHLFKPAGMKETGYRVPKWEMRRIPVGYRDGERWGTMLDRAWAEDGPYWALRGNGGIESTLSDLLAWSRALDGNTVLSAAARKKLFTPHVKEGPHADSFYGYGWAIFTTPWDTKLVAHNGGNGVFSADFARYVDDGIVVITSASDSQVKAWKFSPALGRIAHGETVAPEPPRAESLEPLGEGERHTVIRKFVEAFNTHDLERVRSFRAAHMLRGPNTPGEEQRDKMTQRMWDEFGSLAIDGMLAEDDESVTVRMKPASAPAVRFTFFFSPEAKIAGVKIQAGD